MNQTLNQKPKIISVVLAAGRGTRMKGYGGNKTLLPLKPQKTIFEGDNPIIAQVLEQLPKGPKILVLHHSKEDVIAATCTCNRDIHYCEQPILNGTGGAILAAESLIKEVAGDVLLITMGDVPFVQRNTYERMVDALNSSDMVVLGFKPVDKKQYGILDIDPPKVRRILEWKHWSKFSPEIPAGYTVCNAGIYAIRKEVLERYFLVIASRPQIVQKVINGKLTAVEEYFLTDLVEYMDMDNRSVGFLLAENEWETMGVDDPDSLARAQGVYAEQERLMDLSLFGQVRANTK